MEILLSLTILFSPQTNSTDRQILQFLIEERLRIEYKNADGCPIEPGEYYNLECV